MTSAARYIVSGSGRPLKDTEERILTCIAASLIDDDGNEVVDPSSIGTREVERTAEFAFRADAEAWLTVQEAEGFEVGKPVPLATFFHGPTDSPSNAWAVRARKPYTQTLTPAVSDGRRLDRAAAYRQDGITSQGLK